MVCLSALLALGLLAPPGDAGVIEQPPHSIEIEQMGIHVTGEVRGATPPPPGSSVSVSYSGEQAPAAALDVGKWIVDAVVEQGFSLAPAEKSDYSLRFGFGTFERGKKKRRWVHHVGLTLFSRNDEGDTGEPALVWKGWARLDETARDIPDPLLNLKKLTVAVTRILGADIPLGRATDIDELADDYGEVLSGGDQESPATVVAGLTRLAEQGYPPALHKLAEIYSRGEGVDRDAARAAEWFEEAAYSNFPPAQYRLGVTYARGEGMSADPLLAYVWMSKAASLGHLEAAVARDKMATQMTEATLVKAKALLDEMALVKPVLVHRGDPADPTSGLRKMFPLDGFLEIAPLADWKLGDPANIPLREVNTRVRGTLRLVVRVGVDGSVTRILQVVSHRPEFEQAAIDAARRWHFEPATMGGRPVEVTVSVPVEFRRIGAR